MSRVLGHFKMSKEGDCVSGVCNGRTCLSRDQIDTEKAVEIALNMQKKNAKTLHDPEMEDQYVKFSNFNTTSNETETESVVDDIVEVENNVANTTKQMSHYITMWIRC